jgi:hypothetical protein
MSSNFVPNFKPSTRSLKFINSFPHEPDITVNVPVLGNVTIGDAHNGLCGGMVFTVRDLFEGNIPVPASAALPADGSPLFNFIVGRLFDSFNLPGGVAKYYNWMTTPDHDTGIWPFIRRGVVWHTVVEEWPKIKADIDSGHPSPLGLVTVFDLNPGDMGNNHQVMAYAYDVDANNTLTLHLYDPNTGASDNCKLSMSLSNPSHSTPIPNNVNISFPIRGFFRVDYSAHNAAALAQPPVTATLSVSCTPYPVQENVPQTVTVHAKNASTNAAAAGDVVINGVTVGQTNQPFTHIFKGTSTRRRLPNTGSGRLGPGGTYIVYPKGQVVAPGYSSKAVDFGLKDHWLEER